VDRRDSVLLESIITPLHQRLLACDLPVQQVVTDTNYSNGVSYALLEVQGISPQISIFGKYKPETKGFTYEAEANQLNGRIVAFNMFYKSHDKGLAKVYCAAIGTITCARATQPLLRRLRGDNLSAPPMLLECPPTRRQT
jgi:hypothetical protein